MKLYCIESASSAFAVPSHEGAAYAQRTLKSHKAIPLSNYRRDGRQNYALSVLMHAFYVVRLYYCELALKLFLPEK